MPCRYGSTADHRISVELAEADFEIAFRLVDLAAIDPADATRLAADAETVYADALARVLRLSPAELDSFLPLVGELRREIDQIAPRGRSQPK